jgi:hypothetical protein
MGSATFGRDVVNTVNARVPQKTRNYIDQLSDSELLKKM